ncbi:MAG TPA: hypothetical protein VMC09_10210 [Anaerolineales bacterium]|nr:hypothetical protein [Anaerolineales bacterium]
MKEYQPNRQISMGNLLITLILVTLAGLVIGVIAFGIKQVYYPIFVTPVILALAAVISTQWVFKKTRMRNPLIGMACGVWVGLLIYGTMHFGSYLSTREKAIGSIINRYQVTPSQASQSIDQYFMDTTGSSGFFGYLKWKADNGISFTGEIMYGGVAVPDPANLTITSTWVWLYWLLELTIVCAGPWLAGKNLIKDHFCETHQKWYGREKQIGNVEPGRAKQFVEFLHKGHFDNAAELVTQGEQFTHPTVEIYVQECPARARGVFLTVKQTARTNTKSVKRKVISQGELDAEQYAHLTQHFEKG